MNADADLLITCPLCGGAGAIENPTWDAQSAEIPDDCVITCPLCRGSGRTTQAKVRRMAEEKGMYP